MSQQNLTTNCQPDPSSFILAAAMKALEDARSAPPDDYVTQMGWVLIALQNAFWQLLHAPSLEEGVIDTVRRGGDTDTINQASVFPLEPTAPCNNIASLRTVIDVGAWGNSRFVLPGGQSGNPLSRHYDDLFPLWQRGEGVPIAWTADEVQQATVATLELMPIRE